MRVSAECSLLEADLLKRLCEEASGVEGLGRLLTGILAMKNAGMPFAICDMPQNITPLNSDHLRLIKFIAEQDGPKDHLLLLLNRQSDIDHKIITDFILESLNQYRNGVELDPDLLGPLLARISTLYSIGNTIQSRIMISIEKGRPLFRIQPYLAQLFPMIVTRTLEKTQRSGYDPSFWSYFLAAVPKARCWQAALKIIESADLSMLSSSLTQFDFNSLDGESIERLIVPLYTRLLKTTFPKKEIVPLLQCQSVALLPFARTVLLVEITKHWMQEPGSGLLASCYHYIGRFEPVRPLDPLQDNLKSSLYRRLLALWKEVKEFVDPSKLLVFDLCLNPKSSISDLSCEVWLTFGLPVLVSMLQEGDLEYPQVCLLKLLSEKHSTLHDTVFGMLRMKGWKPAHVMELLPKLESTSIVLDYIDDCLSSSEDWFSLGQILFREGFHVRHALRSDRLMWCVYAVDRTHGPLISRHIIQQLTQRQKLSSTTPLLLCIIFETEEIDATMKAGLAYVSSLLSIAVRAELGLDEFSLFEFIEFVKPAQRINSFVFDLLPYTSDTLKLNLVLYDVILKQRTDTKNYFISGIGLSESLQRIHESLLSIS